METQSPIIWEYVLELTKKAEEEGGDPMIWAIHLSSNLNSAGVCLPSPELATLLVSHICWQNNVPISWKFLEKAMNFNIVPPILVLALLSIRVIPNRRLQPAAFRLYLELLRGHAFTPMSNVKPENYQMIMSSVDEVLRLSEVFGVTSNDPGVLVVEFIFSIVWQLLDASLDDEGLLELAPEKHFGWKLEPQNMEIDSHDSYDEKRAKHQERLQGVNTVMAIDLVGQFLQNKVTSRILHLARSNMPIHWRGFTQRIHILTTKPLALRNSKIMTPEVLVRLISDTCQTVSLKFKTSCMQKFHEVMAYGPLSSSAGICHGTTRSALWLPLDLVLEDAMDGAHINAASAIKVLTGSVKALQAINGATWQDSFLGLWMAALRFVQRERDPIEGPAPQLDTRLSLLLSITPLVVANLIKEEENAPVSETECSTGKLCNKQFTGKRHRDLVICLQSLGDYRSLLSPPEPVVSAANLAAAKAKMFISGMKTGNGYFSTSIEDMAISCSGSLHHLIVEACITRNLLDTSAYFWPGYADGVVNQISQSLPAQVPSWSSFMKGSPLTPLMTYALVSSPASSLAELEKVFDIAVQGSDDNKIAAATILCGASLLRGWNIQEHTVYFITRLLSPPTPADYSRTDSHLIRYAPMLNSILVGISSVDCVQIFSLHGMVHTCTDADVSNLEVPQLAGSLMPICEVFGSCVPNILGTLTTGEEISAYAVFSNAFALLLMLWRFNHPPLEHAVGSIPPVGSQLTPEYLLLVRNSHLLSSENICKDQNERILAAEPFSSFSKPIFVDSFPKLKVWYRQHLACIASPLSGLVHGTPVHQVVDELLTMMFRKINRGTQSLTSATSGSSGSPRPDEDTCLRPQLAAWDILEAVPFVVDAALTACSHGKLSPRELCTGLKDLADFLPASLASIVSYFSAEVSRGVWKSVSMNGVDWPSPAANLSTVEEQIKKILAATGVDVPSLVAGVRSEATLLLPLAAFVSLTITYKLDKASRRFLNLAGPALESLAAGCPWPCMPIVTSLWTQKVKRWTDFLTFSASRTVFLHDKDAVVQLLKSCFTATLGLKSTHTSSSDGVGALLGHGFRSHFYDEISPVAPGILYLRTYRSIRDITFMGEEIISVLMHSVKDIVCNGQRKQRPNKLKKARNGVNYGQVSLASAMTKVKIAASLGATLAWFGGLALVQSIIKETLPSWFISGHRPEHEEDAGGTVAAMLSGYALAHFTMLCGVFAWGVDSSLPISERRPKILGYHLEFLASALDGRTSLGCDQATWRAYVYGFVRLMIECTPNWVLQVDVEMLKRVSYGLRRWDEEELALSLLEAGGISAMGAAVELIIEVNYRG